MLIPKKCSFFKLIIKFCIRLIKNLSKIYLPVLTNEIEDIHNRHVTSGYIKETFDRPFEDQLKILVVGDRNVGKTSLVSRYTTITIQNHYC